MAAEATRLADEAVAQASKAFAGMWETAAGLGNFGWGGTAKPKDPAAAFKASPGARLRASGLRRLELHRGSSPLSAPPTRPTRRIAPPTDHLRCRRLTRMAMDSSHTRSWTRC